MVLFPIALLWIIGLLIWIIRNDANAPGEQGTTRDWKRWRPRPPHRPQTGRLGGLAARATGSRRKAAAGEAAAARRSAHQRNQSAKTR
jgi:hypothetical protein